MNLNLQREDIFALLRGGSEPPYDLMDSLTMVGLGKYVGGLGDHWEWGNGKDVKVPDDLLHHIYMCIKYSSRDAFKESLHLYSLEECKSMLLPYLPGPEQAKQMLGTLTEDEKAFHVALEAVQKDMRQKIEKGITESWS